jgi:hypothetical protein
VARAGVLLRPKLHREGHSGRQNRADGNSQKRLSLSSEANRLPTRRGGQAGREPRQSGARRNLEDAERRNGVPPSVVPNEDDMHGV